MHTWMISINFYIFKGNSVCSFWGLEIDFYINIRTFNFIFCGLIKSSLCLDVLSNSKVWPQFRKKIRNWRWHPEELCALDTSDPDFDNRDFQIFTGRRSWRSTAVTRRWIAPWPSDRWQWKWENNSTANASQQNMEWVLLKEFQWNSEDWGL